MSLSRPKMTAAQQLELIKECRRSGMTDADWCKQNGIPSSTFYGWVYKARKRAEEIPAPSYGHTEEPRPHQDVVPIDIMPDLPAKKVENFTSTMENFTPEVENFTPKVENFTPTPSVTHNDNSHTIEVIFGDVKLRVCNEADPTLLRTMFGLLRGVSC